MSAGVEIVSPGAYASLQDLGRRGFRRIGVPWSGVLDPRLMRIANVLAGNAPEAPVIECFDGGLYLAARGGALRVAVAGEAVIEIDRGGERRLVASWRSLRLAEGEALRIRGIARGRLAVVAVGGLAVPAVLGSASAYARAALGRPLASGVVLAAVAAAAAAERVLPVPPQADDGPIRVVAGPQADHFAAAALDRFAAGEYRISAESDRMGMRLQGPVLTHRGAREIVSDATVPGAVQVPGNGQPIVLLADGQTVGGYPKIATVISTDLPRLAARRPGEGVRFAFVSATAAEALARAAAADFAALLATVRPLAGDGVDLDALYAANLVGGVIHALRPE